MAHDEDVEKVYRELAGTTGLQIKADAAVKPGLTDSGEPGAYVQGWIWVDATGAAKVLASEWIDSLGELPGDEAKACYDLDDKCIHVQFFSSFECDGHIEWPEPALGLKPQDLLDAFCEVWNEKYPNNIFARPNHHLSNSRVISSIDIACMGEERY